MTAAPALIEKARARFLAPGADWLNPIVVKELRQAVQSRLVLTALMVLLSIQLAALAVYLLASDTGRLSFDAGPQVFLVLFAILLGIGLLFMPLYTALRLAAERADANVDLLFITTLKPRSIIAGKLLAAVVLTTLIFSACLPFLTFTYFLRGIDLLSIFVALLIGFAVVVIGTQAAIVVACLPINRAFKALVGVGGLIALAVSYFLTLAVVSELVQQGVGSLWREFQETLGLLALGGIFLPGLLFTLAVALIMPLAANRALLVRVFITVAWLLSGLGLGVWSVWSGIDDLMRSWLMIFSLVFSLALFVAVSERDTSGQRVLRAAPRAGWQRSIAFFFFSGAANGLAWACVLFVLTVGAACGIAWLFWALRPSGITEPAFSYHPVVVLLEEVKWTSGMFLYLFCYALSAAWLRRRFFARFDGKLTWVLALVLLALGSIVPFMIGFLLFFSDQSWSDQTGAWLVGNPFAWGVAEHRKLYALVGSMWALLVVALNLRWFIARVRAFLGARTSPSAVD
jgi:hypothetical protein